MQTQPPAPQCPPWCCSRHPAGGWTIDHGGTYKRCERHLVIDVTVDYTLEQFADVGPDGRAVIDGPYLRCMGTVYQLDAAVHCAHAILELAGLAGIPTVVAA